MQLQKKEQEIAKIVSVTQQLEGEIAVGSALGVALHAAASTDFLLLKKSIL